MRKTVRLFTVIVVSIMCSSCASLLIEHGCLREVYLAAQKENYDQAFLKMRSVLHSDPQGFCAPLASFTTAEYYFLKNDYVDGVRALQEYLDRYPNDEGVIFAEAILYKLSTGEYEAQLAVPDKQKLIESIREKIFNRPFFFIFFDKEKSFSYQSAFGNRYSAIDYVDRVEIRRNDTLFLELTP